MSKLFQKLELKNITLKNKIVVPPMCQYSAEGSFANEWHLVHYGSRAIGGAAAIIQEATAVSPEGRLTYKDLGIWSDSHVSKLSQMVNFVHEKGSLFGIQLAHGGRKSAVPVSWEKELSLVNGYHFWPVVGPSALPFDDNYQTPKELTVSDIKKLISDFKYAAQRALKAGYDIIEIHAAHGYLIHEFLSPFSNHRTDSYGGSFENRIRFLTEIIQEILPVLSNRVSLWVRISATDWKEGGWNIEESVELVKILKKLGVEVIDVSTGGNIPNVKIPITPNYQVPFAKRIKQDTGIITGTVGLITNALQAEEILENNEADFVLIGREILRNPYFPLEAAHILGEDVSWAPQYERAKLK